MNKFSLFDFLIFLLPGMIALQLLYWLNIRIEAVDLQKIPTVFESDAYMLVLLLLIAYILGTVINQVRLKNTWLWSRKEISFYESLKDKSDYWAEFNRASLNFTGKELLVDGSLDRKEADHLFDLMFDLLDQEKKLARILALRMQAYFLENTKTVLLFSGFIWLIVSVLNFFNWTDAFKKGYFFFDLICAVSLILTALLFGRIAAQRWKIFYSTVWRNFYIYLRYNRLTNTETYEKHK